MPVKKWFVDVPPQAPDLSKDESLTFVQVAGPFKKKKEAQEWAAKMYGAIGGKINLVSSSEEEHA